MRGVRAHLAPYRELPYLENVENTGAMLFSVLLNLVELVLFGVSRTQYVGMSSCLPGFVCVHFGFLCLAICKYMVLYLSWTRNPDGHWVY